LYDDVTICATILETNFGKPRISYGSLRKMAVGAGARFAPSFCPLANRAKPSGSSRDRLTRQPQEHQHSAAAGGMRDRLPPARDSITGSAGIEQRLRAAAVTLQARADAEILRRAIRFATGVIQIFLRLRMTSRPYKGSAISSTSYPLPSTSG
jgi:hypothetical protein